MQVTKYLENSQSDIRDPTKNKLMCEKLFPDLFLRIYVRFTFN